MIVVCTRKRDETLTYWTVIKSGLKIGNQKWLQKILAKIKEGQHSCSQHILYKDNIYIYSLCKYNNYSLKSAQHKNVIILWEEDDAKQLYLVLKISWWQTKNLSVRYNDHQKIYNITISLIWCHICRAHFHSFWSLTSASPTTFDHCLP